MPRLLASVAPFCFLGAVAITMAPGEALALTTICTATFTPPNVAPGAPLSAAMGTSSPCPASPVTVTLNTVGAGLVSDGVGTVYAADQITGLGTNLFTRTSIGSVGIGALADTGSGPTTQSFTVTYSSNVVDPHLFFSWTQNYSEFRFFNPVTLLQANDVALGAGNTLTSSGGSGQDSGFVVQLAGTYKTVRFDFVNYSSSNSTAVFTAGASGVLPPVPGPLPAVGLGLAYSLSRRLRRRLLA